MAVARERVVWGVVVREGVVWRAREAVKTGEARREAVETGEGMEARRAARGVTTALEKVAGTKVVVAEATAQAAKVAEEAEATGPGWVAVVLVEVEGKVAWAAAAAGPSEVGGEAPRWR